MESKERNDSNIRNIRLPLAATKPDIYKKLVVVGLLTFYVMAVISYLSKGFFTQYMYLELGIIILLLFVFSELYDYFYRNTIEEIIDSEETSVVIGFSNKLLILSGEEVLDEVVADEIKIRQASEEEDNTFFSKYTTVLDCFKDGELITKVGVGRIVDYEGLTLKADMSRADEDIQIIYEDGDDIDPEDLDDMDDGFDDNMDEDDKDDEHLNDKE